MTELRDHFRPEFLNRIDDIVLFKPLTLDEIERIVDLQIDDVAARLADRRIALELTDEARERSPAHGLRPGLRRPAAAALHPARGRDADRARAAGRARSATVPRSRWTSMVKICLCTGPIRRRSRDVGGSFFLTHDFGARLFVRRARLRR